MKAAVMRGGELVVDEVAEPRPGDGQLLVRTLACGICGSDLHALAHGDQLVEMSDEAARTAGDGMPVPEMMDLARDVVMGHEFAAEVVELGPNLVRRRATTRWATWWSGCPSPSTPAACTPSATRTTTPAATASSWCSTTCSAWRCPTGSTPAGPR